LILILNGSKAAPETRGGKTAVSPQASVPVNPPDNTVAVTWSGRRRDCRWNNPANWEGGVVPGASAVVRFTSATSDVLVDSGFRGQVAGLVLDAGYRGTLTLGRDVTVYGDVVIAGGTLNQAGHNLNARGYKQSGGTLIGREGKLSIEAGAVVTGGRLLT